MQDLVPILTLVGFALLLWLLLVRPQSRRQRELRALQSSLEVGDEVMLTSGVFGTIRSLDEGVANVQVADGVTIKVVRGAIGQVVPKDGPAERDNGDDHVSEEN